MTPLFTVTRQWVDILPESILGIFLTRRLAEQFARQCKGGKIEIRETRLSTYGMTVESARELFNAIAPIAHKES